MIEDKKTTKYVNVNGGKIPVWIYGKRQNPPIIFVHGFPYPFSHYIGDLPIRYLMDDYQVIAFDLPGFGKSKNINIKPEEFIEKVSQELIPGKEFVLFGVSYGSLISLKYALRYPDKTLGVIIAGLPYYWGVRKILVISGLAAFFFSRKYYEVFRNFLFLSGENLKDLKIPVLLLYSKSDTVAKPSMGRKLKSIIPSARLVMIDGRKHTWLLHRVDQNFFLPQIKDFLKQTFPRL